MSDKWQQFGPPRSRNGTRAIALPRPGEKTARQGDPVAGMPDIPGLSLPSDAAPLGLATRRYRAGADTAFALPSRFPRRNPSGNEFVNQDCVMTSDLAQTSRLRRTIAAAAIAVGSALAACARAGRRGPDRQVRPVPAAAAAEAGGRDHRRQPVDRRRRDTVRQPAGGHRQDLRHHQHHRPRRRPQRDPGPARAGEARRGQGGQPGTRDRPPVLQLHAPVQPLDHHRRRAEVLRGDPQAPRRTRSASRKAPATRASSQANSGANSSDGRTAALLIPISLPKCKTRARDLRPVQHSACILHVPRKSSVGTAAPWCRS